MDKRILLIELAGIGDMVLSTPVIRNLRCCFPDAYIGFLTFSDPAKLLKKSPYLDKVFVLHKGVRFLNNIWVLSKLRGLKIETAVNLYQLYTKSGARKIALLLNLIQPKKKIGRDTDSKGSFYDIKIIDSLNSEKHDVEFKLDLLKALGGDVKDRQLQIWFDDSDMRIVGEFLEKNSVSDYDVLIGINPNAHRPSHRWNWKNFVMVADELSKRHKARIIITGSKADRELAKKISLKMSHQPIDTSGRFSLTQLAALIKRCHLYITNDTAPMHIANALKIPLVAIMGPGTMKTAPYQKNNCIVLKKDVGCSPCYKFKCKDMRCLKGITVDEVIQASEILLKDYVKN